MVGRRDMMNLMGMVRRIVPCGRMCVSRVGPAMPVAVAEPEQHPGAKEQAANERDVEKEIVPSKKLDHPAYQHTLYVSLGKQP